MSRPACCLQRLTARDRHLSTDLAPLIGGDPARSILGTRPPLPRVPDPETLVATAATATAATARSRCVAGLGEVVTGRDLADVGSRDQGEPGGRILIGDSGARGEVREVHVIDI